MQLAQRLHQVQRADYSSPTLPSGGPCPVVADNITLNINEA